MNLLMHCMLMMGVYAPIQPPAKPTDPTGERQIAAFDLFEVVPVDAKQPATLEQAIAQALVNHPDMRLAEAELRVAEAKLAQARIQVSQKVTEDFHRLQKERADVELAQANWERMTKLLKNSAISQEEYRVAQHQLASAKARLAATESSWKLMKGKPAQMVDYGDKLSVDYSQLIDARRRQLDLNNATGSYLRFEPVFEQYRTTRAYSNPDTADIVDQLKTKLAVKVKLDKQTNLDMEQAFQKVNEGAGLKIRVKLPVTENKAMYKNVTRLNLEAGEYPLRTWLQLIVDEMNSYQVDPGTLGQGGVKGYVLYVREYGLLLTTRELAPPDAITVQELWKQSQFEKAAAEAKKAQENAAPKK
ncbi:MAG: hypothetical protein QM703_13380 [Gemmatales bacterium]